MLLDRLFRPRPALAMGRALYAQVVEQARTPSLYLELGCPDTTEGRFEVYTLHLMLVLERLSGQGPEAAEVSQALFEVYLKRLDDALREMGVGDLSVGKKMRKLGEAFYGRLKTFVAAVDVLPDREPLTALIGRTVYEGADASRAADLADYLLRQRDALAAEPAERLVTGHVDWDREAA
jgi:cytochrome b pre-mRNA-processing protein 3